MTRRSLQNLSVPLRVYKKHPYFEGAHTSTLGFLSEWMADND